METQLNFYFIDAIAENEKTVQTNYYIECIWEDNNNIHCLVNLITDGTPERPKLTKETCKRFVPIYEFEFNIEDANPSETVTYYKQYKNTDELEEFEVAVCHEREGFTYCADEIKNYIINNQTKWQPIIE